ncbi:hypothetical protein [Tateyamaria sp.]|uniref:hypothetical protein n=1 Tax=Tateyamaria sp. TaxID=1929288 RepID=UPI003B212B73
MMSNNKFLTVSYGTFSCTLEGFDDSFGTMKAIAEYFRDLAADDRYFGAEPPVPDADMLARTAEREISRRVEAREHEGRIVLSAEQEAAAPGAASSLAMGAVAAAAVAAPAIAETAAHSEDAPQHKPAEPVEISVAAMDDLSALDAAPEVSPQDLADLAALDAEVESTEAEAEAEAEEFFAQPEPEASPADTVEATDVDPVAASTAPDSIAAKLQRIREVVSKSQDEDEEDDMFEDEHAEDFAPQADHDALAEAGDAGAVSAPSPQDIAADAVRDIEAGQALDDTPTAAIDDDEDDDDVAAILARFDTPSEDDPATADAEAVAPAQAPAQTAEDLGLDTLAALMASDTEADNATGENLFDDSVAAEPEAEPEQAPKAPAPRARILKVKRADIDAALASGELEEVEDDADESTLSAEEEAELLAELSQVEAEIAGNTDDTTDVVADDAAAAVGIEDDDVSRLMAEADNQMDEPEGSDRRRAFAHLKAAVLAKKADTGIGEDDGTGDDAYRSDLASVVKPRRPAVRGGGNVRPDGSRPAPLKLVAEQRVDVDTAPKGPVRPRRVATREEGPAVDTGTSFEDYASEMGAHDLPALLEAAASYLSFVEGREQFSRPQLMTKVRQVEKEEFSREDGLRSFGQLLRTGKIEKIKGGRFAVTGDIGYRPDQKAAS